jgi:hypothetical protein
VAMAGAVGALILDVSVTLALDVALEALRLSLTWSLGMYVGPVVGVGVGSSASAPQGSGVMRGWRPGRGP